MARKRFFNLFKRDTNLSLGNPQKWFDLFGGVETASGSKVDQETSLKFTGVLSVVSLLNELVASSPKEILKVSGNVRSNDYADPLYKLLAYQPNPYMNAYTFWELNNTFMMLWGNAYNLISRKGGVPIALSPIHPSKVAVVVEKGKFVYRVSNVEGMDGDYPINRILHFKDISLDGMVGKSRIILAKEAIGLGIAAEKFGSEFFGNGSQARGVLQHPSTMGDAAYQNFQKSWNSRSNMGTPILEEGMTYNQITIPPEAAQFIASREFQLRDVARIFRVPPHLINELSHSTFSNIESLDIQFVKYTLRPLVKRYEQELELKLFGDDLGTRNVRFNLDGILRGDTAARSAYYAMMKQNKIMTTNEIRSLENLNPIEGGDILENPATSTDKNKEK